jgi:hypothetical protein
MALVLSERGVGTLEGILRMRTDLAMSAWHFAEYKADWAAAEAELNKKEATS